MSSGIIISVAVFVDDIESWVTGRGEQKSAKWLLESRGSEQLSSIVSIVLFVFFVLSAKFFLYSRSGNCEDPNPLRLLPGSLVVVGISKRGQKEYFNYDIELSK